MVSSSLATLPKNRTIRSMFCVRNENNYLYAVQFVDDPKYARSFFRSKISGNCRLKFLTMPLANLFRHLKIDSEVIVSHTLELKILSDGTNCVRNNYEMHFC